MTTETRELVERLAREAGDDWGSTLPDDKAFLERFAALVAGECAKLAESVQCKPWQDGEDLAAKAIRERFWIEG